MRHDEETNEEVRVLISDPEEIHEVTASAWQDIFRRWDKESKPTWHNFERNYPHLWDTQQNVDVGKLQIWAGTRLVDVIRWYKTWFPRSVAGGIPQNRIQSVYGLLLAMEGEEEGVATAAIDSSMFFDMIGWEVVFPTMGKMEVPCLVQKLRASFVFHLKRFFCQGAVV